MGRWWSQDFLCSNEECEARFDLVVQYDDRELSVACEVCGSPADPVIGAPAVMERALPDGTNRGLAWDRQKEIARLKLHRRNTRPEKRGEFDREIKKIEKKQLGGT
jgi:hypothetical protein